MESFQAIKFTFSLAKIIYINRNIIIYQCCNVTVYKQEAVIRILLQNPSF